MKIHSGLCEKFGREKFPKEFSVEITTIVIESGGCHANDGGLIRVRSLVCMKLSQAVWTSSVDKQCGQAVWTSSMDR